MYRSKEYEIELEKTYVELIKPESKESFKALLVQYDSLLKQAQGINGEFNLPIWCYGWWKGEQK